MSRNAIDGRLLTVASLAVGLVLTAVVAAPASADAPPQPPSPAVTAFTNNTSIGDASAAANSAQSTTPVARAGVGTLAKAAAAATVGKRQTFTRGSTLAWASDTFEWYWSGTKMTSSTGSQACGFIAPNVVTLKGIKRTLAASNEHLWQGAAAIGAQVPTPWSPVVLYSSTVTDYFTLTPGKLTQSNH